MEPFAASAWNRVRWGCVLWRKLLGSRATKPLKAALGLASGDRTKAAAGANGKMNEFQARHSHLKRRAPRPMERRTISI